MRDPVWGTDAEGTPNFLNVRPCFVSSREFVPNKKNKNTFPKNG
jgi:hypothetical protein